MTSMLDAMAQKKKRLGRPAKKPSKRLVAVSVTIPPGLLRRLRKLADTEDLSLSALLTREMEQAAWRMERRR